MPDSEAFSAADGAAGAPDDSVVFLCGDVMTGRGIDQIMRTPSDPRLYESYVQSALGYVDLAERVNGPVPRAVPPEYVWGDLLADLDAERPAVRIANLETAVTTAADPVPKGINYRMHPGNAACLSAAGLDCCTLANNHVLDWGADGLVETLATIEGQGIAAAGAGRTAMDANRPAILELPAGGRVLVYAVGMATSGVPADWAAGPERPGVAFLPDLRANSADRLAAAMGERRRAGDIVVLSIHWGSNWGYEVPSGSAAFAHRLIDAGAVDIVYGHSSHHARPVEIYRGRLILYGCGDLLNDYEGIRGYEEFRDDLVLAWLPRLGADGTLRALRLRAYRIARFRLNRASDAETDWLAGTLARIGGPFGTLVERDNGNALQVSRRW